MPQSSILGWLTKPTVIQEQKLEKSSNNQVEKDELPIPPALSKEDGSLVTRGSPTQTKSKTSETITNGSKQPLISNVELRACTKEDIPNLKQITSLLLPIPYPESFYREIIEDPFINNITLLAIWHDDPKYTETPDKVKGRLIGAIRCKIFDPPSCLPAAPTTGPMLYLSTLVLLSPYRRNGIASHMLDIMTKQAVNDYGITSVGAHVWEANSEGLEWYRKRGFTAVAKEAEYYRRLNPTGAVVMQRRVGVMDLLGG